MPFECSENNFEFLDHPTDLKIRVQAESLSGLFCRLCEAIACTQLGKTEGAKIIFLPKGKKKCFRDKIELEASDTESLLVEFANEIISLSDANNLIYTKCKIDLLTNNQIRATIMGIKRKKYLDIKAATYHDAELIKIGNRWVFTLLMDI